jgi:uncharacterized cupin superfamily protein
MPKIFNAGEVEWTGLPFPVPSGYAWSKSDKLGEQADSRKMYFDFMSLDKGKFSYPYHFHRNTEELFVIISGRAVLRSPNGFQNVGPGDVIFMEMGEAGAHQLFNDQDEPCVYLDIRLRVDPDVVEYPDSGKLAILPNLDVFRNESRTSYFDGEESPQAFWPEL